MITVSNLCGVLNATKLFYFQSFFYNLSKTLIKKPSNMCSYFGLNHALPLLSQIPDNFVNIKLQNGMHTT